MEEEATLASNVVNMTPFVLFDDGDEYQQKKLLILKTAI